MRPLARRFALVAAASLALPRSGFAWSAHGHEMIGRIAQDLLQQQAQNGDAASQATLDALNQLLGSGFDLSALAPCADQIKRYDESTRQPLPAEAGPVECGGLTLDVNPQSAPWHFIDIPTSDSPQSAQDLEAYCPGGACVVDQIRADVRTLQSPDAGLSDKQVALMYLVHFVGDEHQPLHCATEIVDGKSDLGGNDKPITFGDDFPMSAQDKQDLSDPSTQSRRELHALWDQIIEPKDELPVDSVSQALEGAIAGTDTATLSSWVSGDFVTSAALESFAIAQNDIYPAYHQPDGSVITAAYQQQMQPIAEQRIEMAGYRLMALLKQALGQSGSSQAAAQARLESILPGSADLVRARVRELQAATDGGD